ncbi:MFS transporter [Aminobacter sp. AP02]|uniref:MFS transporter n=1 Tax=Aminobacter sp. AP02 TaxID=2135737 RepID=UPI000D6AAA48|nr:MFS transporter [Aminobacter sp. AP02]PWK75657.1 putative MFS family arabinose efflux permease [Aminobacter sp. AP02]
MTTGKHGGHPGIAFALIVTSTVLGIAGTDLVLPAVPSLPDILGGTHARAQFILAAFVVGSALGLLVFGSLGARFDQRRLVVGSLVAYGLVSAMAGFSTSLDMLIGLRFVQGAAGSAAAVFAPGMIRALYGDDHAVGKLGLLGSIESLTPALAPVAGVWLLSIAGWNASFNVIAVAAFALALAVAMLGRHLPPVVTAPRAGGYAHLLRDAVFLRYAVSHAFTLGALLVIVFAAPTVFVTALGATLRDFIIMQITGITTFIIAANAAGGLTRRFGAERMIWFGTGLSVLGGLSMLAYALAGGANTLVITALFVPFNCGLGFRGPPGFHRAVVASRGDDARGAALVVVAILGTTAAGTAAVAPFITLGLLPLAIAAAALGLGALLLLAFIPPLPGR